MAVELTVDEITIFPMFAVATFMKFVTVMLVMFAEDPTLRLSMFEVSDDRDDTFPVKVLLVKALKVVTLAARAVRVETLPVSVLLVKALKVVTLAARAVRVETLPVSVLLVDALKVVTFALRASM